MSFLIVVHVNEGIVLASDRRTTYTNTQNLGNKIIERIGIHTTNTTDKTFLCPNGTGISTCGQSSIQGKPITGFIQDMIRSQITENTLVENIPNIILDYFENLGTNIDTKFIVAGYQSIGDEKKEQKIFKVQIKDKNVEAIETDSQGAAWEGETTTLTRLIQNVAIKTADNKYIDLPYEEILWGYFTLQDAVDFARYSVETTIQTMRFKNMIETVGGSVDILVITPEGANWLQKEQLK
jgi:hypothetical protein